MNLVEFCKGASTQWPTLAKDTGDCWQGGLIDETVYSLMQHPACKAPG